MAEFQALLRAKAEWKPHQLEKAGNIQELAEGAKNLAETVKSTLTLASAAMEIVKFLAMLQQINPLLMALDKLADEVLKQVQDLKEAGFWYLYIDPYFIKNVTAEPAFTYGFEQLRNAGGERLWLFPDDFGNLVQTTQTPTQAQLESEAAKPALATPRKLVPGGYNPYENSIIDPLSQISPYPQFKVSQVIREMVDAFDDAGDVPRYRAVAGSPRTGTVVYDKDGNSYAGWDLSLIHI